MEADTPVRVVRCCEGAKAKAWLRCMSRFDTVQYVRTIRDHTGGNMNGMLNKPPGSTFLWRASTMRYVFKIACCPVLEVNGPGKPLNCTLKRVLYPTVPVVEVRFGIRKSTPLL
jgi:hypothetical protein